VERIKALLQIVNQPWFWFAVALACGVAALLFNWTVSVPARVISVLRCEYSLGRYQTVPASAALVQTADGHHSYTLCQEAPFAVGHETTLELKPLRRRSLPPGVSGGGLHTAEVFVYFGVSMPPPRFRWWERGRKNGAKPPDFEYLRL
jgi:hypothetical protein